MSPSGEDGAGDEVVVPDEVSGPGQPRPVRRDAEGPGGRPGRRDRKPLIAIVAGLTACWFTLFGPLLVVILAPTAIVVGRRVLRRIESEGGTDTERKQAKIGFWAGIVAVALLALQVLLFQLFFEWEKDQPAIDDKATATTEAPG